MTEISIKEKATGATLASGSSGDAAIKYEGNWYFSPGAVENGALTVTERTYRCPIKGVCNWVDFQGADGRVVKDVAWVYPDPKAGHEAIKGRFGFYAGSKGATVQESRERP